MALSGGTYMHAAVLLLLAFGLSLALPPANVQPLHAPKSAASAAVDSTEPEAVFERCPQGPDWVKFRDSCYLYVKKPQYWEPAEQNCIKAYKGHMVSVRDRIEDSFLAKLTYCRDTWLGRYAVNVDLLSQSSNYRWTDGTSNQYEAHNFTGIPNVHHPLVSVRNLEWWNNVYHAEHPYVCKVNTPQRNFTCGCPTGWRELDGYCYLMPKAEATYIEADFFCRGRDAYLTSIHSQRELRAMSLLDIDSHGCPFNTWVGLVKLNPCRVDFATGTKICYHWSDRSGDYTNLPKWQAGSPIEDQVTNCAVLVNEEIKSVPCYTRARFVCKQKVPALTPAGAGAPRKCML